MYAAFLSGVFIFFLGFGAQGVWGLSGLGVNCSAIQSSEFWCRVLGLAFKQELCVSQSNGAFLGVQQPSSNGTYPKKGSFPKSHQVELIKSWFVWMKWI